MALGAIGVLFVAMIFGGASRDNTLRVALVELAALPLLGFGLWRLLGQRRLVNHRLALALAAFALLVPLVQLIPLPIDLWRSLPGRADAGLALQLAGAQPSWLPMSLTPDATWASALALIPPLGIFVAVLGVSSGDRRWMLVALVAAAAASIVLGIAQVLSGKDGPLYLYEMSSFGYAGGFFANRNHQATLLVVAIVVSAALLGSTGPKLNDQRLLSISLILLFLGVAIVAIGLVRSRAGILLGVPALGAALLVFWNSQASGARLRLFALVATAIGAGVSAIGLFAWKPILDRFAGEQEDLRFVAWPDVLTAANTYLPWGSGIGSFDPVYRSVEPPERLNELYFNHAHNDYLELWLEAGWPAAFGVAAFVVWLVLRSVGLRSSPRDQQVVGLTALIALGLMAAHSYFDYPLRTEAILCTFALCCALLERSARSRPSRRPTDPTEPI